MYYTLSLITEHNSISLKNAKLHSLFYFHGSITACCLTTPSSCISTAVCISQLGSLDEFITDFLSFSAAQACVQGVALDTDRSLSRMLQLHIVPKGTV